MSLAINEEPLLKVDDLKVHFTLTEGFMQKPVGSVKAVDGVSFELRHGETWWVKVDAANRLPHLRCCGCNP